MYPALDRFLVAQQSDLQFGAADAIAVRDWSIAVQHVYYGGAVGGRDHFQISGQIGRGAHSPRYSLAVQETRVVRLRLKRVPEGVAKIENAAQPGLPFIRRDDFGLDPH